MRVPAYFDYLIEGFRRGAVQRRVHLGYWDAPPRLEGAMAEDSWTDAEFARAQRRLDERMIALADLADGQRLLDVGCGFGGTIEAVNARHAGMQLCGVNIDPRQLEICRGIPAANGNRLDWREADACALPFADGAFDRVLCIEAMFHFSSRRAFFREAARVLAPGGALVGTDLTVAPVARALDAPDFPIERTLQEGYGPWADFWSGDADHRHLGEDAGLRCAAHEDASAQTRPSHQFTAPAGANIHAALATPAANSALCAALMLKWLHTEGHLRYQCFRFDKPREPD